VHKVSVNPSLKIAFTTDDRWTGDSI